MRRRAAGRERGAEQRSDRLTRRCEPGDIVAFINTAGYQMDLSASAALMQRQPVKAVIRATAGGFAARADTDDQDRDKEAGTCSTSTSPS